MKILLLIFLIIYLLLFFFAKVKVNNLPASSVWERALVCGMGALVLTILIGLPILGVICLVGGLL